MTSTVVCFGELLLRLSAPGHERLLQSPALQVFVGGAEANVAAALSAWGRSAAVVSSLPNNSLGAATLNAVRAWGVDTRHIVEAEGRMGLYFYTQGAMQRPSEVLYDRAASSFALVDPGAFDWKKILADAKWLHVSGITAAVSERAARAALNAMQTAQASNVRVSFDSNYRARVWGARAAQAPGILKELCSCATLLFADDRDLALMLGSDADARAAFATFPNLRWLVRTERGVESVARQHYAGELRTKDQRFISKGYELSGIIERIGAGDAFAAGILHCLLEDENDPQRAVDFATAAACYKHSVPGDQLICSIADIEAVLAERTADIKR